MCNVVFVVFLWMFFVYIVKLFTVSNLRSDLMYVLFSIFNLLWVVFLCMYESILLMIYLIVLVLMYLIIVSVLCERIILMRSMFIVGINDLSLLRREVYLMSVCIKLYMFIWELFLVLKIMCCILFISCEYCWICVFLFNTFYFSRA